MKKMNPDSAGFACCENEKWSGGINVHWADRIEKNQLKTDQ